MRYKFNSDDLARLAAAKVTAECGVRGRFYAHWHLRAEEEGPLEQIKDPDQIRLELEFLGPAPQVAPLPEPPPEPEG